jgi:hypothetical protein
VKFTLTLPYEEDKVWSTHGLRRPSVYSGERIESEVLGVSVTVSFEFDQYSVDCYGFGHLSTRPEVINESNVDAILKLFSGAKARRHFGEDVVPSKWTLPVVGRLLSAKGWGNSMDLYDVLFDQEGFGFMGGSGCGRLLHKLHYTKVLSVKPSLKGVRRTLAAMQFNGWLGEVKEIRDDNKHIREALTENDLFVTWSARPICQDSVHHWGARGFLLEGAGPDQCTCTKCAKKLGITVNANLRKRQGADRVKTPDVILYRGWTIEAVKHNRAYMLCFYNGHPLTQEQHAALGRLGSRYEPGMESVSNTRHSTISDVAFTWGKSLVDKMLDSPKEAK